MGRLIYTSIASLDGFVADARGEFGWAAPDDEVHAFVNGLTRATGTHLYGRRTYEVMTVWDTMPLEDEPPVVREFAEIWRSADKIVFSSTLTEPSSGRTRIERRFEPDGVHRLKEALSTDLGIGGPTLAAAAVRAGLVDEVHLLVVPVVVGGGTSVWPGGVHWPLELLSEQRFAGGTVHLHYRTTGPVEPAAGG